MNDNKDKINNYLSIDNNLLDNLCKNNDIKKLINLSISSDINVFNKKKKININSKVKKDY
jgi:hypothetical protein